MSAHLEVKQRGSMMKTPVQKGVLPLMVRLLWAIPILWNQSPQYSLNYQICTSTKMEQALLREIPLSREINETSSVLSAFFLPLQQYAFCYLNMGEWITKKSQTFTKVLRGLKQQHLTVFTYLCLCTFEIWPWLAGNLREYKGTSLSWDCSDVNRKLSDPSTFWRGLYAHLSFTYLANGAITLSEEIKLKY